MYSRYLKNRRTVLTDTVKMKIGYKEKFIKFEIFGHFVSIPLWKQKD